MPTNHNTDEKEENRKEKGTSKNIRKETTRENNTKKNVKRYIITHSVCVCGAEIAEGVPPLTSATNSVFGSCYLSGS